MILPQLQRCCCYFSLATGTWIIGWWNLVHCILVMFTNCMILSKLHFEDGGDLIHAEHMLKMTIIVKLFQSLFTLLLLVGSYKGHRMLIFCWIIANSTFTLISIVLYFMMITSVLFKEEIIFSMLSVFDIYCIVVVICYYREVHTTC
ncbi:uncharacterized protein LOC124357604 [Homalodisca vitripennis]|uniref:uncharacterized protein LOC124357604 n=1 Tax=Homalodisca vitripennis TaxID=197043 RepID=UPI001EEA9391|nr:uncharacterized protein LOC124357604 [Homalodisca vitripennis]